MTTGQYRTGSGSRRRLPKVHGRSPLMFRRTYIRFLLAARSTMSPMCASMATLRMTSIAATRQATMGPASTPTIALCMEPVGTTRLTLAPPGMGGHGHTGWVSDLAGHPWTGGALVLELDSLGHTSDPGGDRGGGPLALESGFHTGASALEALGSRGSDLTASGSAALAGAVCIRQVSTDAGDGPLL